MRTRTFLVSLLLAVFALGAVITQAQDTPQLGITFQPDGLSGLVVTDVTPDSPAQNAGLQPGDVLVALDGTALTTMNVRDVLADYVVGDTVELLILRVGESMTVNVTLGLIVENEPNLVETLNRLMWDEPRPRLGLAIETNSEGNVQILDVVDGSPAAEAGLQPGDVVLQVDGTPVNDVTELVEIISASEAEQPLELTIERDGETLTVTTLVGLSEGEAYLAPPN